MALPEYNERRMMAGRPKAEQIRRTGAHVLVAACENCRLQIGDLSRHYGLPIEISALADLVVKAMRLPNTQDRMKEIFTAEEEKVPVARK